MVIALRYAARSNLGLGPKSRNEDSGYAGPNLLVIADGMGGHAAGDVASSMIVGELAPLDDEDVGADQAVPLLERGLRTANEKLTAAMRENPGLAGMGSTTIVMLRTGTKLAMAHIGDSRAFLLRGDGFTQITKDHSFVQQLVDEGRISKEEASSHPQRSVVTRVMTGQRDDEPDTSLREAKPGDRFLLCSDGLSDFVGAEVIEEILRGAGTPDEAADRCIEVALKASTRDNVTVVVADVIDADSDDLPVTVPQVVGAAARRLRDKTRAMPTSPAEKAAALSRETRKAGAARNRAAGGTDAADRPGGPADDDSAGGRAGRGAQRTSNIGADGVDDADDSDDDGVELAEHTSRSGAAALARRTLGGLVVLVVLGVGAYAAWTWTQRQLYVGVDDSNGATVAIYRGVPQNLGPIVLSHVESTTGVLVTDLPDDVRALVDRTIPVADLAEADDKVQKLWFEAVRCRVLAATGTVCGTTPGSLVTPVPTVTAPAPTPSSRTSTGTPSRLATSATLRPSPVPVP